MRPEGSCGSDKSPGSSRCHVHLCGDGSPRALDQFFELSPEDLEAIISRSLHAHLVAGVTAVRDLGDYEWAVVDRRRGAGNGQIEPTIVAAGPPITIENGHCWSMGGVTSGDELRQAVRDRAERGADVVGLDADLLVVDGNPLHDMTALRAVHTVVSRGREVELVG